MARANPDAPDAPDTGEQQQAANTVRLRLNSWPVDAFDPSIDGVSTVTADGIDVPANKADAVIKAASAAGLTVEKVS